MLQKTLSIVAGLIFAFGILTPAARADEHDQSTRLTFDRSVEIPGQVLPAGTYWFVVVDDPANRNIVNIFDAGHRNLLGTVLAISAERLDTNENTQLKFIEEPKDQLKLVGWFYPDDLNGHEFVYNWSGTRRYSPEDVFTVIAQPDKGRLVAQR